jgi:hypothetical protein
VAVARRPYNGDMSSAASPKITPGVAFATGGRFLDALTVRDFDTMASTLDPDLRLRALLPSRDVDVNGRDAAMDEFRRWLGPDRGELDVLDACLGEVGAKLYLRWRLQFTQGADISVLEQHAYATTDHRITGLSVLCSGYMTGARS